MMEAAECDVCGQGHITEDCPMLGLSTSDFKAQISRARLTVPHYLGVIDYPDGEVGIMAIESISNKTQLGPFEAKKTCLCPQDDVFFLKILSPDGNTICLDASSENHCNWMALVQVATTTEEQNCMAYQLGINIYFNTTRDIPSGTPLKVWYATKYAQKLGKPASPDGKTKSMLGIDISSWPSEDPASHPQTQGTTESLFETATYLSAVMPSSSTTPASVTSGDPMAVVLVKEEGQTYSCSKCSQVFYTQSDFAIHLRGHLMPTSLLSHMRGGKRGRPWNRAGVIVPMGRRGPGRPKKTSLSPWKEPGELMAKTSDPPKRRGRPRKVVPSQTDVCDAEGNTNNTENADNIENDVEMKNVLVQDSEMQPSTEKISEDVSYMNKDSDVKLEESGDISTDGNDNENQPTRASDNVQTGLPDIKRDSTKEDSAKETSTSDVRSLENEDISLPTSTVPAMSLTDTVIIQADKTPKKRGRPPISKTPSSSTSVTPSRPPHPLLSSLLSRRVQPRRTLKGKRTSTFRYPGESSSEEEEEEKVKGKNVLKQALKTKEYSDDDDDDVVDRRSGMEEGEVVGDGVQITVQTQDGIILSKAPVILLDEETGQAQALDPATLSLVSAGVDSSGQEVMVLQQSTPTPTPATIITTTTTTTTTATPTTTDEVEEMTPNMDTAATAGTGVDGQPPVSQGCVEGVQGEPPVSGVCGEGGQGGLETLVNAALSSHHLEGAGEGNILHIKIEDNKPVEEDGISDDPDWKGPASVKRDGSVRRRKAKRRKGDDPDMESLEESIQVVEGPNGSTEYACGVCAKRFQQIKYLKMHLPAHTDKYLCNDCGRRFARHESLQKHVCEDWLVLIEKIESEEDGSILYRCKECGRSFPHIVHARRHSSMHRGTWVCSKCLRTFPKRQLLLEHKCGQTTDLAESGNEDSNPPASDLTSEGGEGEGGDYACDICHQSFSNTKYLFRHMAMHTELFKCLACGKCYSRKDSLQRHVLKCCPQLAEDYSAFACEKCKKTFGTRLGLENHVLNCSKSQCNDCRIAFFNQDDLAQHKCEGKIIDDAAGVQFPCKECGKTFASLPYLARHEASHHAAFECPVCKKVFVRIEELSWHQPVCEGSSAIERDGVTHCDVCQTQFTEVRLFREHFQVHTHPYRCDKCGKRFIKVGTLHTHKCDNAVTGTGTEEEGSWQCDICEKTFKNERYLARHKQLHGLPSFDCEYCGKKFIRKDYLNDHKCVLPDGTPVRVVRKKNRLYIRDDLVCPHCKKTFSSRSNLNKHIRVHGDKEAECHVCGKKFHYHSYLKLHIATVHDRQYQYQCSHCGKILFSKTGLIAHIKQFHQDTVKLFPCPKCGKTFRQKGNMRTHLYSHTKERTFKCEMCSKSFKYPDQLNRHRLEHTLNEKIKCAYCDKRFVRASELRQHERLFHSGVIYTCHVCHESCAHKHTIVRHYRRKHPEMADIFEKQPDFLESLQKSVDKSTSSLQVQRLPIQLTAPGGAGDHKPRIIRVMADGQEQEYIITTTTPLSSAPTPTSLTQPQETATMQVGDQGLPYATLTADQGHEGLPQEAVQVLQDMSGMVYETDGNGMITQTVEDADGNQTVIILQVVNQDEMGNVQEVTHLDSEQIAIQEISSDLGIEVPMEVTTTTTSTDVATSADTEIISYTTENVLETDGMESVVIDAGSVASVHDGTITIANGTITVPEGTVTAPDGSITISNGNITAPTTTMTITNGTITIPEGTVTNPDGSITISNRSISAANTMMTIADGTMTVPEGTITNPDGSITISNGSISAADTTMTIAEGTVTNPDGSITMSNGSITAADTTMTIADGTMTIPEGSISNADGTVTISGGTITGPEGSVTISNGRISTQHGTITRTISTSVGAMSAPEETVTFVTAGSLATEIVEDSGDMEVGAMTTNALETGDRLEVPTVVNTVVGDDGSQHVVRYL